MSKELFGVKIHDAGLTMKEMGMGPVTANEEKNRKDYPSLCLRNDQIPQGGMALDTGDKVVVVAVCHVRAKEDEKREKEPDRRSLTLEVEELGFKPAKGKSARKMSTEELKAAVRDGTGSNEDEEG